MTRKILWVVVSFLLVAALVLTSCAKEEVVVEEEEEEEEEEAVVEEEEEEEEPAVGEPQYGGTLTVFYKCGWDPATADVHTGLWPLPVFVGVVQDCLIMVDFEKYGPRGTGEIIIQGADEFAERFLTGALVESWEVTADEIILDVRPGVYWAAYGKEHVMESRELTADDIAFSLNRFVRDSPAMGMPGAMLTENGGFIDAISADGRYTVVIETNRFDAMWLFNLAFGWCQNIVAPEVAEADITNWNNLVGTGAFMVKKYMPGSAMIYERNPRYWGTTTINGKEYPLPFIDELIYPIIADASTLIASLRTGKIDVVYDVALRFRDTLEQTSPELITETLYSSQVYMALNMQSPILINRDVRRALTIAIDRENIVRAVFGEGDLYAFPVSKGVADVFTPLDERPASIRELFVYDPVKAGQMLADAGYAEGFRLKALLSTGAVEWIDIATMIKEYWAAIDVTLDLVTMEPAAYTRLLWASGAAGSPGVVPDVPYDCLLQCDAAHDAPIRSLSQSYTPSGANFASFYSEDFMTRFNLAMATVDDNERNAIFKELAIIGLDSAAYIPIAAPARLHYWWPWVKNFYGEGDVGSFWMGPIYAALWIDQELKAEMGY